MLPVPGKASGIEGAASNYLSRLGPPWVGVLLPGMDQRAIRV